MAEYKELLLDELMEPPVQVRASIEEEPLQELADSIRAVGLLQPLVVVADGAMYEIVAGHRRYLACRRIYYQPVPCIVHETKSMAKEAAMLHENLYRTDLTAADEALFYAELIEKYDCTEADLCRMVRQSPSYVNQRVELLRFDPEVFQAVRDRKVVFAVARELNRVKDEKHRRFLLRQAMESDATARVVKRWVEDWKLDSLPTPTPAAESATSPPTVSESESGLRCVICGGTKDPQNLRHVYLHWWELEALEKMLREGKVAGA